MNTPKLPYLKDSLKKHSPVDDKYHECVLDSASDPKNDNYGKVSRYCKITIFYPSVQETCVHFAKDFEAPFNARVGDKMLVRMSMKGWPEWSIKGDVTENQPLQMVSNTQLRDIENRQKEASENENKRTENYERGKVAQILGMIWKSFMQQESVEKDISKKAEKALKLAIVFRQEFDKAVDQIYAIQKNESNN